MMARLDQDDSNSRDGILLVGFRVSGLGRYSAGYTGFTRRHSADDGVEDNQIQLLGHEHKHRHHGDCSHYHCPVVWR